jgi:hypothetical protein
MNIPDEIKNNNSTTLKGFVNIKYHKQTCPVKHL